MPPYEYGPEKRRANLEKHALDLEDARHIYEHLQVVTIRSHRAGEARYIDVAPWRNELLALVYAMRGELYVSSRCDLPAGRNKGCMKKRIREVDWERVRKELADILDAAREENVTLIRYDSDTGEAWKISPDGTIEPYELGPSQTDFSTCASYLISCNTEFHATQKRYCSR